MTKPRLLDLYCCQGGAARGYADAGFEVVGVDLDPQPRYPYEFHPANALEVLADLDFVATFDAIHASPPCQRYTRAQVIRGREHPDLVDPTRRLLRAAGLPYVIENVEGAPLRPDLLLCGTMFGLRTYRHRIFEFGNCPPPVTPPHRAHTVPTAEMGRTVEDDEFMTIVGNFAGVELAREIMGMPWASRPGLAEAIPPVFTELIGHQLIAHVGQTEPIPLDLLDLMAFSPPNPKEAP